jgi:hypothetical protein
MFAHFIYFAYFVKIVFAICVVTIILLDIAGKEDSALEKKFEYWKVRTEFIFVVLMALLLIYLFRPSANGYVDKDSKFLLFIFGWVLLITAEWSIFTPLHI